MSTPQKILLVGAGAVGQAYGFHLAKGGAEISYYVREKYIEALGSGVSVRCHNGAHAGHHHFNSYSLISQLEDVAATRWDQVWLCVSSPALRSGWLEAFSQHTGDATLVMLQPGLEDHRYVSQWFRPERVVRGMITLTSYQAPLEGSTESAAMSWWFPPLSPALFSGSKRATELAVSGLKRGGMPAKRVKDITPQLRLGSALLMPLIAGLESEEWRLTSLGSKAPLSLSLRAARQCMEIALPGQHAFSKWLMTRFWLIRLVLALAPRFTPFDLEAMLRSHFTKVSDQTREMLEHYIGLASELSLPDDAIVSLVSRLEP